MAKSKPSRRVKRRIADPDSDVESTSRPKRLQNGTSRSSDVKNLKSGLVYVFGSGDCGQLGMGEEVDALSRPRQLAFLDDKFIVSVAAGGLHSLALSKDGKVYSWGCNDEKALGHCAPEFTVAMVQGLEDVKIVQIACGDSISVALSDQGKVYAWGTFRDSHGILGFDTSVDIQDKPVLVKGLSRYKVVAIACGSNHVVALTDSNRLFSWGSGERGQLGRRILERHTRSALLPQIVNLHRRTRFEQLSCGSYHSMAIDSEHQVYSWGLNNYGQLGHGDKEERLNVDKIPFDMPVIQVQGGEHHSLLLTEQGNVYSFGRGDSCQLGHPEQTDHDKPRLIQSLSNVEMISTGTNHNLAFSKQGLFAWGFGEMNQLGTGKEEDEIVPVKLKLDKNVLQLAAGGQHSVILVDL